MKRFLAIVLVVLTAIMCKIAMTSVDSNNQVNTKPALGKTAEH